MDAAKEGIPPHMLQSNIISSVHRRATFLLRYLLAKAQSKSIRELLPVIERLFDSPWVARVELNIRFWPGGETTLYRIWRSLRSLPKSDFMHWDAPVTVSVFRKRKGKERQALCMSLYIQSEILYIAQLQGVPGTDFPRELGPWAQMFIEACKQFARQQGLREVRVPKASTLISFLYPYGWTPSENHKQAVPRIRRNMELLYDSNALQLGMVPDGDWFRWQNPRLRGNQPAILQHAIRLAASFGLVAATTAVLHQLHDSAATPQRLVFYYLLPLVPITLFFGGRAALLCAGVAILCADYFLQDPMFSLYTSEWDDLIWFTALAVVAINIIGYLPPRGDRNMASSL
jgi:hypothetical protein